MVYRSKAAVLVDCTLGFRSSLHSTLGMAVAVFDTSISELQQRVDVSF